MRRKDKLINEQESWEIVDKAPYVSIACVQEDQTPYIVNVSAGRKDNVLYFHCAKEGKKSDILAKNPNVCVSAVSYVEDAQDAFTTYYDSSIMYGVCERVENEEEKKEALYVISKQHMSHLMDKFEAECKSGYQAVRVYKIIIHTITGKSGKKKS